MNKETRLSLIKEYRDQFCPYKVDIHDMIGSFASEELTYAAIISLRKKLDLKKEIDKVIETYTFDDYSLRTILSPKIEHILNNPEIAAMQHCLIECISFLGEFYDGTPCGEGRPSHTFWREWDGKIPENLDEQLGK